MARTAVLHDLIDLRLNGQLNDILRGLDREGLSFELMAHELRVRHNVQVSYASVRRWLLTIREQDAATAPI